MLVSAAHRLGVPISVYVGSIETALYFNSFKTPESATTVEKQIEPAVFLLGMGALAPHTEVHRSLETTYG